jgi:hypothetical protein
MDDEVDAFGGCYADLEQASRTIRADQHREVVQLEHADWVAVGVEHVVIGNPVLPGACQDCRIHSISTYLDSRSAGRMLATAPISHWSDTGAIAPSAGTGGHLPLSAAGQTEKHDNGPT